MRGELVRSAYSAGGSAGLLFVATFAGLPAAQAQTAPEVQPPPSTAGCADATPDNRTLVIGRCVVSALDEADPVVEERVRYEDYSISLARGQAVQFDLESIAAEAGGSSALESYSFDPYLEVRSRTGDTVLRANDDRPGSLHSRLTFTAPTAGAYTIRARSYAGGTGRYVIHARPSTAERSRPLSGSSVTGTIAMASYMEDQSQPRLRSETYHFEGRALERIRATVPANPAGTTIRLQDESGLEIAGSYPAASDTTELVTMLPRSGRYYLEVQGRVASDGAPTPFTLTLDRATAPAPAAPLSIDVGTAIEREMTIGSAAETSGDQSEIDFLYEYYLVDTNPQQPVTISVEAISPGFDPVVEVGVKSELGFAVAQSDDDGGDGLNARLVLPEHPAQLLIRVRSIGFQVGRYRLLVTAGAPVPAQAQSSN